MHEVRSFLTSVSAFATRPSGRCAAISANRLSAPPTRRQRTPLTTCNEAGQCDGRIGPFARRSLRALCAGLCKPSLVFFHEPMFASMLLGAATCPPPTFPALFLRAALPSSDSFIGDYLKLGQVELGPHASGGCSFLIFRHYIQNHALKVTIDI